jgi:hypothetical protein
LVEPFIDINRAFWGYKLERRGVSEEREVQVGIQLREREKKVQLTLIVTGFLGIAPSYRTHSSGLRRELGRRGRTGRFGTLLTSGALSSSIVWLHWSGVSFLVLDLAGTYNGWAVTKNVKHWHTKC